MYPKLGKKMPTSYIFKLIGHMQNFTQRGVSKLLKVFQNTNLNDFIVVHTMDVRRYIF